MVNLYRLDHEIELFKDGGEERSHFSYDNDGRLETRVSVPVGLRRETHNFTAEDDSQAVRISRGFITYNNQFNIALSRGEITIPQASREGYLHGEEVELPLIEEQWDFANYALAGLWRENGKGEYQEVDLMVRLRDE